MSRTQRPRLRKPLMVCSVLGVTLSGFALLACAGASITPAHSAPQARDADLAATVDTAAAAAAATAEAVHAVQAGEIRAELERYYADFSARDWPAFAAHFWPGATITTVWQPEGESVPRVVVTSLPDFVAQAPRGADSKALFEERMLGAETRIEGDLAQVWARYEARFGDPGAVEEWTGIDAFTLLRHDGAWKIVSLAFTRD